MSSYYYSATLISDNALLWNPDDRTPMRYYDEHRRRVPVSAVMFPASKGVLAEVADFHDRNQRPANDPHVENLNTLFADASVRRTHVVDVVPSLEVTNMFLFDGVAYAVPFVGTPNGAAGKDLR